MRKVLYGRSKILGKKEYFVNCQEQRGVISLIADLLAAGRTKALSYEI